MLTSGDSGNDRGGSWQACRMGLNDGSRLVSSAAFPADRLEAPGVQFQAEGIGRRYCDDRYADRDWRWCLQADAALAPEAQGGKRPG